MAAERPDLALDFAIHLMQSNLGASTPIDTWNVMLYIMPGEEARRLLDVLALSPALQPDVHSFTAGRVLSATLMVVHLFDGGAFV